MKFSMRYELPILLFIMIPLIGFGCFRSVTDEAERSGEIDREHILSEAKNSGLIMTDAEIESMTQAMPEVLTNAQSITDISAYQNRSFDGWQAAALADVTGGGSFGLAHTTFSNNTFTLIAEMGGLPFLEENMIFEGWLVRRGEPFRMISTGPITMMDEKGYNIFVTDQNISDFDFFVLTIETLDGNPSPSKHLLEGTLR